jgi:hypothetical protein
LLRRVVISAPWRATRERVGVLLRGINAPLGVVVVVVVVTFGAIYNK